MRSRYNPPRGPAICLCRWIRRQETRDEDGPECLFYARLCTSAFTFLVSLLSMRLYYHQSYFTNQETGWEVKQLAETPTQWQHSCSKPGLQTTELFLFSATCCPSQGRELADWELPGPASHLHAGNDMVTMQGKRDKRVYVRHLNPVILFCFPWLFKKLPNRESLFVPLRSGVPGASW